MGTENREVLKEKTQALHSMKDELETELRALMMIHTQIEENEALLKSLELIDDAEIRKYLSTAGKSFRSFFNH